MKKLLTGIQRLIIAAGIVLLMLCGRLPARRKIGAGLGLLVLRFARRRRHIAAVNIHLTHPDKSAVWQQRLLRQHFMALGEWLMDNLWALSATRNELRRYFRLEGEVTTPCIILAPHFLGLELALLRLNLQLPAPAAYHYKPMHSAFWNTLILYLRQRFGGVGFSTDSKYSLLAAVRHCRRGGALCYLPDIDPRARKSTAFVPFMAVEQAATTTGLSRLAQAAKTPVVPYIICRTAEGYVGKLLAPIADFPSGDEIADAKAINALIGEWVEKMPENYFWLHRRFKTDAQGKTKVYD
ncbi:MAG: hypothetical protein K0U15_02170 [Proteobacteria bacterium]|nr:hypothetical protein [Pseudomonadota bacterium]